MLGSEIEVYDMACMTLVAQAVLEANGNDATFDSMFSQHSIDVTGLNAWSVRPLDRGLAQTEPANEMIVVDDGSADDGPDIVKEMAASHPIRLLTKTNGVANLRHTTWRCRV